MAAICSCKHIAALQSRPDHGYCYGMTNSNSAIDAPPRVRLRVLFGEEAMLGPGKADLLEHIRDTGSIAAAGRAMSMSYKRAWSLVDQLNSAFQDPLVERVRGGANGGGARLSDMGEQVLEHFRKLEDITAEAGAARINAIRAMLRDTPSDTADTGGRRG